MTKLTRKVDLANFPIDVGDFIFLDDPETEARHKLQARTVEQSGTTKVIEALVLDSTDANVRAKRVLTFTLDADSPVMGKVVKPTDDGGYATPRQKREAIVLAIQNLLDGIEEWDRRAPNSVIKKHLVETGMLEGEGQGLTKKYLTVLRSRPDLFYQDGGWTSLIKETIKPESTSFTKSIKIQVDAKQFAKGLLTILGSFSCFEIVGQDK